MTLPAPKWRQEDMTFDKQRGEDQPRTYQKLRQMCEKFSRLSLRSRPSNKNLRRSSPSEKTMGRVSLLMVLLEGQGSL